MLWPPPVRGDRATVDCACQVRVRWRVPFVFIYVVIVEGRGADCRIRSHDLNKHHFVRLERFAERRRESGPS
jgi:hypothetical protein